jgi:hypothetical protein
MVLCTRVCRLLMYSMSTPALGEWHDAGRLKLERSTFNVYQCACSLTSVVGHAARWRLRLYFYFGKGSGGITIVAASSVTASRPQPHFSTLATDQSQPCSAAARTEAMLSTLPTEILLEIIQGLPPKTIASLPALSKSWATFMATNESSIYHFISKQHGYADSDAVAPPEGWKTWCK